MLRVCLSVCFLLGVQFFQGVQRVAAQTVIFSDNFDYTGCNTSDPNYNPLLGCGGGVNQDQWFVVEGMTNGYREENLVPSSSSHQKNHTGPINTGGSAFEVDSNPYPYATYHDLGTATSQLTGFQDLRLSVWVWDDAEWPLCNPYPARIGGMVGLTTAPGAAALSTTSCGGGNGHHEIYPYADYAFLGVESASVATDPQAGYYQWRTSTDGWHVTNVPRKVNNICHGSQTWRHLEIVVHPFSGRGDDIEFLIDGVVVGQGHRTPGATCAGLDFQRIQLGGRFPEQSDVDLCRPPYSYEHFWFDDVALTAHPAALLPCPNRVLRYDADGDGDVDMTDFAAFQRCYTPNINSACPCRCMDGDADGSIDAADLETFLLCVSGDHIPADITCDDALP